MKWKKKNPLEKTSRVFSGVWLICMCRPSCINLQLASENPVLGCFKFRSWENWTCLIQVLSCGRMWEYLFSIWKSAIWELLVHLLTVFHWQSVGRWMNAFSDSIDNGTDRGKIKLPVWQVCENLGVVEIPSRGIQICWVLNELPRHLQVNYEEIIVSHCHCLNLIRQASLRSPAKTEWVPRVADSAVKWIFFGSHFFLVDTGDGTI